MYGDEHKCEVSQNDLKNLEYSLERQIEFLRHEISKLEDKVKSLREDLTTHASYHLE